MRLALQTRLAKLEQARDGSCGVIVVEGHDGLDLDTKIAAAEASAPRGATIVGLRRFSDVEPSGGYDGPIA